MRNGLNSKLVYIAKPTLIQKSYFGLKKAVLIVGWSLISMVLIAELYCKHLINKLNMFYTKTHGYSKERIDKSEKTRMCSSMPLKTKILEKKNN